MSIFGHEWRKIYKEKKIVFIFIGLFILNAALLYISELDGPQDYSAEAYMHIFADLEGLSSAQALAKLAEEQYQLMGLREVSFLDSSFYDTEEDLQERFADLDIAALIEQYQSGDYLKYTTTIWHELNLYRQVIAEIEAVHYYDQFLERIDQNAESLSTVSLFSDPDTFAYRNIMKTPQDFAHLKGVQLTVAPSKGVTMATQFFVTDVIAVLLLLLVCIVLMTREKEQGCLGLLKTSYRGRVPLVVAKMMVVICSSLIIMVVLHFINFSLAGYMYGFGELERQMQSVAGYLGSTLDLSVLHYFILFLIAKLVVYMLVGLFIFCLSIMARSSIEVYLFLVGFFGISALLYFTIPAVSIFSVAKFINIVHFLHTYTLFSNYLNLNLLGWPVNYMVCFIVAHAVLLPFLFWLAAILFSRQREIQTSSKLKAYLQERVSKWRVFQGEANVSIFRHETYKLLVVHKVFLVLFGFLLLQIYMYEPYSERFQSMDEVYYKQYMLQLEGELTAEKEQFLAEEQHRFAEIREEMLMLGAAGELGQAQLVQLSEMLVPEVAFERVLEQADYLRSMEAEGHRQGWFLYDTGYRMLTAEQDNVRDFQLALVLLIMLITTLSAIFTYEFQTHLIRVISPTLHGRTRLFRVKLWIAFGLASLIFGGVYLPELINVLQAYGTRAIEAPVYSMFHLREVRLEMSILGYLIGLHFIRYLAMLLAILIIFAVSVRLKSWIAVALTASGILILPLLLSLLEIGVFDYMLLTPLLAVNLLFKEYSFMLLEAYRGIYYGIVGLGSFGFALILYRYFRARYKRSLE